MSPLHPLLARQLERLGLADGDAVASPEQWRQLLQRVSRAYQEADQERYLFERSQDLASAEMTELYGALEAEKAQLESRVSERTGKLRESETHLAEAQRIATLGSWTYVPQTRQLEWSEECFRLFGFDSGVRSADVRAGARTHSSRRPASACAISSPPRATRARTATREFRIVRENGQTLWLHAIEETFTNAAGQVILMRGTLRDITRQKQAGAGSRPRDGAAQYRAVRIESHPGRRRSGRCRVPVGALERTARWRAAGNVHDVRGADGADARRRA